MAIKVAKVLGARVVTTVGGPEKAARARELGADTAVDYRTEDFTEHGPYDVILDVIGGDYLERNIRSLAVDGRLVVIGLQNGLDGKINLADLVFKRLSVHGTTLRTQSKERRPPSSPKSGTRSGRWSRAGPCGWSSRISCPSTRPPRRTGGWVRQPCLHLEAADPGVVHLPHLGADRVLVG
ncbi:zinc-binding dehydrogenase [Streptomyces sp. NEAU-YJ-81]|uniref:zinc-binding dehydrogenase n=1 Tax=Streptomyces sp. NEAU-YJ-81 TaxID=2820288 RepID=UPI001FBB5FC0|nr:zinc-binding dehydrogenase [Streptomyces sp. NEAU-YJ-81]